MWSIAQRGLLASIESSSVDLSPTYVTARASQTHRSIAPELMLSVTGVMTAEVHAVAAGRRRLPEAQELTLRTKVISDG